MAHILSPASAILCGTPATSTFLYFLEALGEKTSIVAFVSSLNWFIFFPWIPIRLPITLSGIKNNNFK